jgi:uncharacterized protein
VNGRSSGTGRLTSQKWFEFSGTPLNRINCKERSRYPMRFLISFTVIFGLLAADAGHETRIAQWRAAQESKLKADDGWLTVTGLFWLKEGANTFGSASSNRIVLPAHSAAPRAGVFELRGGKVRVQLESQVAATVGGEVVREAYLRSDAAGQPDRLLLGDLTLFVIERGGRYAIRLKDKRSALRRDFRGLDWFPVRSTYHVEARFHPYGTPRPVRVATATGGTEQAGRFLYTPLPQNGRVVLDFNKAENPPCAYTPYATCPLPPKENRLPVAIEAGEKYGH